MAYTYAILSDTASTGDVTYARFTLGGGAFKAMIVEVTPDAATGSIDIAELANSRSVFVGPSWFTADVALSANLLAHTAVQNSSTDSTIDYAFYNASGAAGTITGAKVQTLLIFI